VNELHQMVSLVSTPFGVNNQKYFSRPAYGRKKTASGAVGLVF
jgi:hypothetical protein